MNKKIGLVLEGGGFRGIYSAGILDYFLEKNIEFPYVIGVSMGACNAANYVSKQLGRSLAVNANYINDKRYISYKRLFTKGELFGMDFVFDVIPDTLIPFDFDTFHSSKQQIVVVTTNCETGKPVYINDFNKNQITESLKASSSLPFASKMVSMNNMKLLDGGIVDSIPYKKAFEDGCDKIVVILTQPKGYKKESMKIRHLGKIMYNKYPELIKAIYNRHNVYNKSVEEIEKLEKEGKAFVIRPELKVPVGRTEKNREKLEYAFNIGYNQSEKLINSLKNFCEFD